MKTETLELQFNDYKQVWTIEAKDWEKGNAHRIYFSLRLQGERYGEPRQAIWDVNAQSWMAARMDASKMLGDHLIRLYNLLPEPEPPTPTETSEVESVAGQTQEAETSASTIKASSAWQFLPFDGYYQAPMSKGRIVRCNKDSFAEAAQECAEAGIELTPENALAYGWDDFYMVDEELAEEVKQPTWGGARKGAGAKPSERSEPLYQQGYQAGYKAASRKPLAQWDNSPYPLYISGPLTERAEAQLAAWGWTRNENWEIEVPKSEGDALISIVTGQSIILVRGFAFILRDAKLDLM